MGKRILVGAVVVAALGLVLWASLTRRSGGEGVDVLAEEVERRSISKVVKASGAIDPRVKVDISAHVIAKISELYVEEGDEIEAGEPFLELEKVAFTAGRDRAAAALEIARSDERRTRLDVADAELQLQRMERLSEQGIVAPERLEAARLAAKTARLRLEQAREAIRQATADLERAEDDLDKTTIFAPISGRVIELNAEAGEVVVSGTMNNPASVIGTIADLSELLAVVDVDETEIVSVEVGQRAGVTVDALPEETFGGQVIEVGSSGFSRPNQPDVTFFAVEILLDEPDRRLRPGMSTRADIQVATHEDTLVVPIQCVVYRPPVMEDASEEDASRDDEVQVVFVVEEGKAVQRPVEVGIADATHIEILTGLDEGELVITGPYRELQDLEDGAEVEPSEEDGE